MFSDGLVDDVGCDPHCEESHRFLSFFDGEDGVGGGFDETGEVLLIANAEGTVNKASQDHARDWALLAAEGGIIKEGCDDGAGVFDLSVVNGADGIVCDAEITVSEKVDDLAAAEAAEGDKGSVADGV